MWVRLDKSEQDAVHGEDPVVSEWYCQARDRRLRHAAALDFAQKWDAILDRTDMDTNSFDQKSKYLTILNDYTTLPQQK
jgi:hypothetical protein